MAEYSEEDFYRFDEELSGFDRHVSIPNILTETSNLLRVGKRELFPGISNVFDIYCKAVSENLLKSSDISSQPFFYEFGLTDAGIALVDVTMKEIGEDLTIWTDDGPLFGFLAGSGAKVYNFSHLRTPAGYP